jgi:hypothetical protein
LIAPVSLWIATAASVGAIDTGAAADSPEIDREPVTIDSSETAHGLSILSASAEALCNPESNENAGIVRSSKSSER